MTVVPADSIPLSGSSCADFLQRVHTKEEPERGGERVP